jgi:predicted  nucleic acid-binding Zn-ribbon protein
MNWHALGIASLAVMMAACNGGQKEATEAALDAAQTAISTVQGEAAKYVPDQLKETQDAMQSARDALAKGDYQGALNGAQNAANKARELAAAAAAKKEELSKNWTSFNETLPKSLEEAKRRLDAYSHGAKLPAGLDKEMLPDARAQYDQLKQGWTDAVASFQQGNLADATRKAEELKEGMAKLAGLLGMKT